MITLLHLAEFHHNGVRSFISHLVRSFGERGIECRLIKLAVRTEPLFRELIDGVVYQNVAMEDIPTDGPRLITYTDKSHHDALHMLSHTRHRPTVVLYDLNDILWDNAYALYKSLHLSMITTRRSEYDLFARVGLPSIYIPMPYVRAKPVREKLVYNAVTLCRIFLCKRLPIVFAANRMLPPELQCHFFGDDYRFYTKYQCDKHWPEWRANFHGHFTSATQIAACSKFVIDLTQLLGSAGGTQYTFFEAWDAGATLVLHKDWGMPPRYCLQVNDAESLADVLRSDRQHESYPLTLHAPMVIVPQYLEILNHE